MPIPSPGTYDVATQSSLSAVKAKTDLLLYANMYTSRLTDVDSDVEIPASTTVTVDIQPPAGETWLICIHASLALNAGGSGSIWLVEFDGVNTGIGHYFAANSWGYSYPSGIYGEFHITNTKYLRLFFTNSTPADVARRRYHYHGFKE